MSPGPSGRDLFIVHNSVSGWTGLRYLEEWTGIAKAFDIATGYFEMRALLALEGKRQQLEKSRILMGGETSHRTRKALFESVKTRAVEELDQSIEADKSANPFLQGVPQFLTLCGRVGSNAACTTVTSFTRRPISRTPR